MRDETIGIPGNGPGTRHSLRVLRFGRPGARPQVYVQGGLHADEGPGMLAAALLAERLAALDAAGQVTGEVIVVPAANPLGLDQIVLGAHLGRFALRDGGNFNRGYPDLAPAVAERLRGRLGPDSSANTAAIRAAAAGALAALPATDPPTILKHALLGLALGADWVLDLHCDAQATVHVYTLPALAGEFAALGARLGSRAMLTAEVSGDNPFDEATSRPWVDLAAAFPDAAIPLACRAATVELRGEADVDAALGLADAGAILDHLREVGAVTGEAPPAPATLCAPTPLEGTEPLKAPIAGLVLFHRAVGDVVAPGELVAEVLDPMSGRRAPVAASTAGVLFARMGGRLIDAGGRIGKVAGAVPFRTGLLLGP